MVSRTAMILCGMVAIGLSTFESQAKVVRYEIEGQQYSYDTKSREQVALARERLSAAKAAAAARAKVEAERAANPLVRIFGSQIQTEAKLAEAQLQQALAKRLAVPEEPRARGFASARKSDAATTVAAAPSRQPPRYDSTGSVVRNGSAVTEEGAQAARRVVEAIVFDLASGIKTVHLENGTVEEEPFDAREAAALKRAVPAHRPHISFVNEPEAEATTKGSGEPSSPSEER